jgi:hypothetical protein
MPPKRAHAVAAVAPVAEDPYAATDARVALWREFVDQQIETGIIPPHMIVSARYQVSGLVARALVRAPIPDEMFVLPAERHLNAVGVQPPVAVVPAAAAAGVPAVGVAAAAGVPAIVVPAGAPGPAAAICAPAKEEHVQVTFYRQHTGPIDAPYMSQYVIDMLRVQSGGDSTWAEVCNKHITPEGACYLEFTTLAATPGVMPPCCRDNPLQRSTLRKMLRQLFADLLGRLHVSKGYAAHERAAVVRDAFDRLDPDPITSIVARGRTETGANLALQRKTTQQLNGTANRSRSRSRERQRSKRPREETDRRETSKVRSQRLVKQEKAGGASRAKAFPAPFCTVCGGAYHQHGVAGAKECKISPRQPDDCRCHLCGGKWHKGQQCPSRH